MFLSLYFNSIVDQRMSEATFPITVTNLVRCMFAAEMIPVISSMIQGMGTGWYYSLLGAVLLCFMVRQLFSMIKFRSKWKEGKNCWWVFFRLELNKDMSG